MTHSADLITQLQQIQARVLAEHQRTWLYADEHPEALDSIADHTIVLTSSQPKCHVWALPAGWVQIVNRLHRDLLELRGEYVVTRADQKSGRLCYYIAPASFDDVVQQRITAAQEESRYTCELCGAHADEASNYEARCRRHASRPGHRILGAMARPPGEAERLGLPVREEKLKTLMLHAAVAPKLIDDPEGMFDIARANIKRWLLVHRADGMTAHYLREWEHVIDQGVEAILGVFGGYDERSCDLRQNSPFAGVLTDDERLAVLEQWKAERGTPYSPSFVVPESLDDLHGSTTGEVTLPNRLLWNPSRPFDLADEKRLRSMMRIVIREAQSADALATYLDRDLLIEHWPSLRLPDYITTAWEERFPVLRQRG